MLQSPTALPLLKLADFGISLLLQVEAVDFQASAPSENGPVSVYAQPAVDICRLGGELVIPLLSRTSSQIDHRVVTLL